MEYLSYSLHEKVKKLKDEKERKRRVRQFLDLICSDAADIGDTLAVISGIGRTISRKTSSNNFPDLEIQFEDVKNFAEEERFYISVSCNETIIALYWDLENPAHFRKDASGNFFPIK